MQKSCVSFFCLFKAKHVCSVLRVNEHMLLHGEYESADFIRFSRKRQKVVVRYAIEFTWFKRGDCEVGWCALIETLYTECDFSFVQDIFSYRRIVFAVMVQDKPVADIEDVVAHLSSCEELFSSQDFFWYNYRCKLVQSFRT